jgi:hypothetical protein
VYGWKGRCAASPRWSPPPFDAAEGDAAGEVALAGEEEEEDGEGSGDSVCQTGGACSGAHQVDLDFSAEGVGDTLNRIQCGLDGA